ncbi:hypothetical protein [Prosthecobacter sp.]|uniref:hypothetical protein n=1 Tax=Prosthecobacter sp. TaxID=1965333 RepID=UPI0037830795
MSLLPPPSSDIELRQQALVFLHAAWCSRELGWKSPPDEAALSGWVSELVQAALAAQATTARELSKVFYHQLQLMELIRCGRSAGLALTQEQAVQFTQDLLADRLLRVTGNNLGLSPEEFAPWSRDRRHYVVKCALDSADLPERLRRWLTPGNVFPEPLPGYLDQAYLRTCTAEMLAEAARLVQEEGDLCDALRGDGDSELAAGFQQQVLKDVRLHRYAAQRASHCEDVAATALLRLRQRLPMHRFDRSLRKFASAEINEQWKLVVEEEARHAVPRSDEDDPVQRLEETLVDPALPLPELAVRAELFQTLREAAEAATLLCRDEAGAVRMRLVFQHLQNELPKNDLLVAAEADAELARCGISAAPTTANQIAMQRRSLNQRLRSAALILAGGAGQGEWTDQRILNHLVSTKCMSDTELEDKGGTVRKLTALARSARVLEEGCMLVPVALLAEGRQSHALEPLMEQRRTLLAGLSDLTRQRVQTVRTGGVQLPKVAKSAATHELTVAGRPVQFTLSCATHALWYLRRLGRKHEADAAQVLQPGSLAERQQLTTLAAQVTPLPL